MEVTKLANNIYPLLSIWGWLGFIVNQLPEHYDTSFMTFDYIYDGIHNRNLFENLENAFTEHVDFSMVTENQNEGTLVYDVLNDIAGGLEGRESHKTGIKTSGQRLLLSFIIEAMQQKYWRDLNVK